MIRKPEDERIGKHGGQKALACAITGEALHGSYITYALGNGWYYRVLSKHDRHINHDKLYNELNRIVSQTQQEKTKGKVNHGD